MIRMGGEMQVRETLGTLWLVTWLMVSGAAAAAGHVQEGDGNAVTRWNSIASSLLVDPGPILEGRAFAILHAAIHDAANGVERHFMPYAIDLSSPDASLDAAVATAARDVLMALSPSKRDDIESAYLGALAEIPDGPAKDAGVTLGRQSAKANIDRRANDGIASVNEPAYVPTLVPGDYDFTPPFDAPPLGPAAFFPGFGRLTPFAIDLKKHRARGPDRLSSTRYAADLNHLKSIGSVDSSTRTPEQTQIAFFWYEEPNLKWNRIANAIIRQHHLDAWEAARILALVNFAINDGGIACMAAKYQFRFWRPYTAIRRADEDGNPDTEADVEWQQLFSSPPFLLPPIPDYPSALATLGSAAGEVLIRRFGDTVCFDTTSTTLPNVTRHFERLTDAMRENGQSRIYGGIHFVHAVEDGNDLGRGVGRSVSRMLPPVLRRGK